MGRQIERMRRWLKSEEGQDGHGTAAIVRGSTIRAMLEEYDRELARLRWGLAHIEIESRLALLCPTRIGMSDSMSRIHGLVLDAAYGIPHTLPHNEERSDS